MKPKLSIEQLEAQGELIALVSEGKLTPRAAEKRALKLGCAPLTSKPGPNECDPNQRARWTLVMTVAWIAWRDLSLVRESSPEYADATTQWRHEELIVRTGKGRVRKRIVSSIQHLRPRTRAWLYSADVHMRSQERFSKIVKMPVSEAFDCLWGACERGDLTAEGIDQEDQVKTVPKADWPRLRPFDEKERLVLKRNGLDSKPAYTEVSFRQSDVKKCWSPHGSFVAVDIEELIVEKSAYAPLEDTDEEFVPLSSAIYWIATKFGTKQIKFGDSTAWEAAAKRIAAKIQAGEIELIGRNNADNEVIAGVRLAGIPIRSPVDLAPGHISISAQSHICCSVFTNRDDWLITDGDRFYPAGSILPTYTHLQVRNGHVLNSFPQPAATDGDLQAVKNWLISEMRASPERRPKNKSDYKAEAAVKLGVAIGPRPFNNVWREAVEEAPAPDWIRSGPSKGSVQYNNRVRNTGLKKG